MNFTLRLLDKLSIQEFYEIYKLRNTVFVVEQNCPYQDIDDNDPKAYHLMMSSDEGILIGYCRILPPGLVYKQPAIGRVAVVKSYRGKNFGEQLMKYAISKSLELFDGQSIVISAQEYLINFYSKLGFLKEGELYLEDNISHIKMKYTVN